MFICLLHSTVFIVLDTAKKDAN